MGYAESTMVKNPKKLVKELSAQVGRPEAKRLLVVEGVSISTADKLVRDVYKNEVGLLIQAAILKAVEASKKQAS